MRRCSLRTSCRDRPTRDELISEVYQQEVTELIEAANELMSEEEPVAALRGWLMLFVEFLDAKHGMAAAMDTLLGGPESIYSKTPHRLDVPVKALVSRGSPLACFGTTSNRTICFARSPAWRMFGRARTGNSKQFGWWTFCSAICSWPRS